MTEWGRALVILNPGSGMDGNEAVHAHAAARGWPVRTTTRAGDASAWARRAAEQNAGLVVAAGGDGTVHEIVHGLIGSAAPGPHLGVIPLGTGNDFARNTGLPLEIDAAFHAVEEPPRAVDVVRLEIDGDRRVCINALNGGFSGQVSDALTDEVKERWGRLSYLRVATESLTELTPYAVSVETEAGHQGRYRAYNVAIANGPGVGGGFPIAPEAHPCDGLADLVLVRPASIPRLTTLLPAVLSGQEPESALFQSWRTRQGRVHVEPPLPFSLDGEVSEGADIRFEVLAGAIQLRGGALDPA